MLSAIWAVIKAIAAYLNYRFDPEQIARRDEINKKAAEELNRESIDKIIANKNVIPLELFISEFLRLKSTNTSPGWTRDLQDRIIPRQRSEEDRNKDTTPGFDDGQ